MGALLDRRDVPVLAGSELIYFDSATTSLVPMQVLDAVTQYYRKVGAVGRGTYKLAAQATAMVVNARETAAGFFNCEPE
jgi:cysteine desulfurase/selenocysteine lyase